jgi:hypothetical protein
MTKVGVTEIKKMSQQVEWRKYFTFVDAQPEFLFFDKNLFFVLLVDSKKKCLENKKIKKIEKKI